MKKVSLKTFLLGLGWASVMNLLALTSPAQTLPAFGNLPLYFEAVPVQANRPAQFTARGDDCQFLISPLEVQFKLHRTEAATHQISSRMVQMQFVGAGSQAHIFGSDELPGKINYLVGNNPAQWRTGVATFSRVRVEQLYPGISLVYYGSRQQLEYDFTLAPGANPDAIKIHFDGVDKISIGARGGLVLTAGKGEILQRAPVIYQTINGVRKTVNGGYRILDQHTVAFTVGEYDHHLPLVIDPVLNFSSYFGGNSSDTAWSVALDTNGFIYVAGQTLSKTFYPTNGAFQTNFAGGNLTGDAFIAKLDNQGSRLIYFTYLGGSADDAAYGIAVDGNGDAYITGLTDSKDFPVRNAIYPNISGVLSAHTPYDAFVAELDPEGTNLVYSTYLGGGSVDAAFGIAVDLSNNVYVTGVTYSTNFPTTADAFQKHLAVTNWAYQPYFNANAFVTEIGASGSNLLYSSYFGGTNFDIGMGVAVDASNYVYLTGFTASTNFPTTNAIFQTLIQTNLIGTNQVFITNTVNGSLLNGSKSTTPSSDAFVAKFAPSFSNLIYSTFLGGTNRDVGNQIAVDSSGNAYVTGWTVSTNFPNTAANVAGLYNGLTNSSSLLLFITNAFLAQITWTGSNAAIGYSAVFGGTWKGIDIGYGVGLDPAGDAFVVGASSTTNFPVFNVPGMMSPANAGRSDAFVIAFNTNGSAILYSGYLGGSANDYGYGIAVDALTNAYVVGQTASANFPIFNEYQTNRDGSSDAFLTKIGWVNEAPVITNVTIQPTNEVIGTGVRLNLYSVVSGTPPLSYHWQLNGTNLVNGTNIFGATNSTMVILATTTNTSGSFRLVVTNYAGSATSSNIVLMVTPAPLITQQPTNETVSAGSSNTFLMNGFATPPYTFQWFQDGLTLTNGTNASGSVISGATNYFLTIDNVHTNDAGNYWFTLTNNWGAVTSDVVTLTVIAFPTIEVAPTNQTVGLGSFVSFHVAAIGAPPLNYQWQLNGVNLADGTSLSGSIISGSTNANLFLQNVQTNDDGSYSIIVTNSLGAVTNSPPAVLTVLAAPTFLSMTPGADGSFIFSGSGGTNGGTYLVYTSTNVALPLNQWTAILVNGSQFGSQGQFVFTNTPPANLPQRFYILKLPTP